MLHPSTPSSIVFRGISNVGREAGGNMAHSTVVAVFDSIQHADKAVSELQEIVAREDISLVGQESVLRESQSEGSAVEEGLEGGATGGAVVGGITGLITGISALAIPGVGPVITLGAIASALGTAVAGAGIGAAAGGLIGALIGLGIPESEAESYAASIREGNIFLAVRTNNALLDDVIEILERHEATDLQTLGEGDTEAWQNINTPAPVL